MQNIPITIFCLLTFLNISYSQDLKDLAVPSAPAFILLDQAPTSIERPQNAKAFGLSIVNAFLQQKGLPISYAAEFTPFWFTRHPNLTSEKYYGIKTHGNNPFSSAKLMAVSIAYNQSDSINHNLAIGFRSTLIEIRRVNDIEKCHDKLTNRIASIPIPVGMTPSQIESLIKKDDEVNKHITELNNIIPLFSLEAAAAFNNRIISLDTSLVNRLGVWTTGTFSTSLSPDKEEEKEYLNHMLLARYTYDAKMDAQKVNFISHHCLDVGTKLELVANRFSIGLEVLGRINFTDIQSSQWKLAGVASYKITNDLYIQATLGKQFEDKLISGKIGLSTGLNTENQAIR
jgi:hypothetical protein